MDAKRLTEIDKTYLRMAYEWASLSRAKRMQVGCLVETENTVMNIMIGKDKTITKPEVLHAESNAITKLAKSTQTSEGATMYLTLSPCLDCAKLIIQAGIKRVVYSEQYRIQYGIILLKQGNISIEHLEVEV
jgi:dCMP deaminase